MEKKTPSFSYGRPFPDKGHGVTMENVSREAYREIRMFIGANHMDDPDYHTKFDSCAFLQGDSGEGEWVFIEFWSKQNCHNASVNRLRDIFRQHHPEGWIEGVELLPVLDYYTFDRSDDMGFEVKVNEQKYMTVPTSSFAIKFTRALNAKARNEHDPETVSELRNDLEKCRREWGIGSCKPEPGQGHARYFCNKENAHAVLRSLEEAASKSHPTQNES